MYSIEKNLNSTLVFKQSEHSCNFANTPLLLQIHYALTCFFLNNKKKVMQSYCFMGRSDVVLLGSFWDEGWGEVNVLIPSLRFGGWPVRGESYVGNVAVWQRMQLLCPRLLAGEGGGEPLFHFINRQTEGNVPITHACRLWPRNVVTRKRRMLTQDAAQAPRG